MRRNRGFTLIEVMLVVAVLAVFAAIAVPNLNESFRRSSINSFVRALQEDIARAHTVATSNTRAKSVPSAQIRSAMIRFQDASSYELVVSDAPTGANPTVEETWKVVSLPDGLRLVEPIALPQNLIFRSNGAMMGDSASRIVLEDTNDHRLLTLEISMMGTVKLL
jgi:prepilin-type N-terminal cleavage/methylation domain-containing protein